MESACEKVVEPLEGDGAVVDSGRGLDWRLEALDENVEKRRSHGCCCCCCGVADAGGLSVLLGLPISRAVDDGAAASDGTMPRSLECMFRFKVILAFSDCVRSCLDTAVRGLAERRD